MRRAKDQNRLARNAQDQHGEGPITDLVIKYGLPLLASAASKVVEPIASEIGSFFGRKVKAKTGGGLKYAGLSIPKKKLVLIR